MKTQDKTETRQNAHASAAHTANAKALQKKAVGVVQKVEPEEEVQQQKSDGTVQKMDAPEPDEEHPAGVTQHKHQPTEVSDFPVQRQENKTGMPDHLKSGIEHLSGMSMDHVKVHYNSSQPAQLNALAYAQGSEIHVAAGQEKHLPHEAWHVVQQAQGRVQPTTQMKAGVPVNDDPGLEHEADVMGDKALSTGNQPVQKKQILSAGNGTYQLRKDKRIELAAQKHYKDGWGARYGVEDDATLKGKVDDSVTGSGEVSFGYHEKNRWVYSGYTYRNLKKCNVLYKDEAEGVKKYRTNYTSIYHCGPTGGTFKQYWDGAKWVDD